MKNFSSFFLVFLLSALAMTKPVFGQCTPDSLLTSTGIYPKDIPPAYVDTLYATVVDFIFPADTVVSSVTIIFDSLTILNVSGLPTGFSYQCNELSCTYPGGGHGCISVTGDAAPGMEGIYPLRVTVRAYYQLFGNPAYADDTSYTDSLYLYTYYGVAEKSKPNQRISLQVFPNPSDKFFRIRYSCSSSEVLELSVNNILGALIYYEPFSFAGRSGEFILQTRNFPPGIYFLALYNGCDTARARAVIVH